MRRINTPTTDVDLHGPGKDGFTNGDPGVPIPPTQLDALWHNNIQEETSRAIEGAGFDLVPLGAPPADENFSQLDDSVQAHTAFIPISQDGGGVLQGLRITTSPASLSTTIQTGIYHLAGRRYVITSQKLTAASINPVVLAANQDSYYFIAPEDPGAPSTPPDRTTVFVQVLNVPLNDPPPVTPSDTSLFAIISTNGAGVTGVIYPKHGLSVINENGVGIFFRRPDGIITEMFIAPTVGSSIDIGILNDPWQSLPELGSVVRSVAAGIYHHRVSFSSLNPQAVGTTETRHATTLATVDTKVSILDASNYPEKTVVLIEVHAAAFSETTIIDNYTALIVFHARREGALWDLDGTAQVVFERGQSAIVAQVGIESVLGGGGTLVQIELQAHSADTMRWFLRINYTFSGPA